MDTRSVNWIVVGKATLAIALLSALAGVAGSVLAPQVPLSTVLLYGFVGATACFGLLLIAIAFQATLGQAILRNGGTDTQWLWFQSEPPGLAEQREQQRKK